jgi:arylsulfatase A-like enzyme
VNVTAKTSNGVRNTSVSPGFSSLLTALPAANSNFPAAMKGSLLAGLAIFLVLMFPARAESADPNVVVFLIDDMGIMDTSVPMLAGPDGKPRAYPRNAMYRTPNMERLAARSTRFGNFQAMSVCSPSRASLLTGQNPSRHGTTNWIHPMENNRTEFGPPGWNWKGIAKGTTTLPGLLQEKGYRTIHFGKGHFGPVGSAGEDPRSIGFDVNVAGCSAGHPSSYFGKDNFASAKQPDSPNNVPGLEKYHGKDIHLSEALTLEAIAEIDKAAAAGKPFFLNFAHYAVHTPFQIDPRFAAHHAALANRNAAVFATLIEGIDTSLGQLLDHLEKSGLAENTLVLFLGDNGSDCPLGEAENVGSSAPLRGKKGSCYEGGVRIPFIAAWARPAEANPAQARLPIAVGGHQNQLASVEDVFPTLARMLRLAVPVSHAVDGQDLARLLTGAPDPARARLFLMHYPHDHRSSYWSSLRLDEWKVIYRYRPGQEQPRVELYHLGDDPFESRDLSSRNPEQTRRMVGRLAAELELHGAQGPVKADGSVMRPVMP